MTSQPPSSYSPEIHAPPGIRYVQWQAAHEETYLTPIRKLISKDLSEPYSIYVYRYFLYQWGDLCYMVYSPFPPFPSTTLDSSVSALSPNIRPMAYPLLQTHRPSPSTTTNSSASSSRNSSLTVVAPYAATLPCSRRAKSTAKRASPQT